MLTGLYTTAVASGTPQPQQAIAANEKDEKWHLNNAWYIYSSHYLSPLYMRQLQFPRLLTYATGRQDVDVCMKMLGLKPKDKNKGGSGSYALSKDENGNKYLDDSVNLNDTRPVDISDYSNVNWSKLLSPAPKLVDKIIGMLDSHKYKTEITAIDQTSLKDKVRKKNELKVLMKEKDFIQNINQKSGMEIKKLPEVMPETEDEVALLDKMGAFDLNYERALRKGIKWTETYSDIADIDRELKYDAIVYGFMAAVDRIEPNRDIVVHEHLQADNVIIEYSKGANSYDSSYGGYLKFYTIMDIRYLTGWV